MRMHLPTHSPPPIQRGRTRSRFSGDQIRLDDHGRIEQIEKVENDVSHQLIEEFMLLANEAVAARLMSRRQPAIYRVYEEPDDRRLQEWREEVLSYHCSLRQPAQIKRLKLD